jgi:integrase
MTARYQYGTLTPRKRKKGPDVWQFRWMENGKPKSVLIGTVEKYSTRADAERAAEHLRITINAENPQQNFHSVTVGALIDRFMEEYAPKRCRLLTQKVYRSLFENHIRPRWGKENVPHVKTIGVENWLEGYPHSRQIKSHIRNLMHTLFQAAIRWEMIERNPIDLVRQSRKRRGQALERSSGIRFGTRIPVFCIRSARSQRSKKNCCATPTFKLRLTSTTRRR